MAPINDPNNPTQIPISPETGTTVENSDFKDFTFPNGTHVNYIRFYRTNNAVPYAVHYATSNDGVHYTRGRTMSFEPYIADGYAVYPFVVKNGTHYYMFICNQQAYFMLFDVTNPDIPIVLNNGLPVLVPTHSWENGNVFNMAVTIVGNTWYMLYEAYNSTVGAYYNIGFSYSTMAELNWTKHTLNYPVLAPGSCPTMVYVPNRNALFVLYDTQPYLSGLIQPGVQWGIYSAYAYLSDDLTDPNSWHINPVPFLVDPEGIINFSDPSLLIGYNSTYNIMISWCYDQGPTYQSYLPLSLDQLFDYLKTSTYWDSSIQRGKIYVRILA